MGSAAENLIPDVLPEDTWSALKTGANAKLVDCRTAMEWSSVGIPDLDSIAGDTLLVEWKQAPSMGVNPQFAEALEEALGGTYPDTLFFICRSGVRSREAATFIQDVLSEKGINCACVNVAEGFEGRQPSHSPSGWKAKGLPSKLGGPA